MSHVLFCNLVKSNNGFVYKNMLLIRLMEDIFITLLRYKQTSLALLCFIKSSPTSSFFAKPCTITWYLQTNVLNLHQWRVHPPYLQSIRHKYWSEISYLLFWRRKSAVSVFFSELCHTHRLMFKMRETGREFKVWVIQGQARHCAPWIT